MQSILKFILRTISIVFWAIFIYLMFLLVVGVVALIANYDVVSSADNVSMPAIWGTTLSPGFTAIFIFAIAYFTWKWGGVSSNDNMTLIEKMKTSISIMFNKRN